MKIELIALESRIDIIELYRTKLIIAEFRMERIAFVNVIDSLESELAAFWIKIEWLKTELTAVETELTPFEKQTLPLLKIGTDSCCQSNDSFKT